MHKFKLFYIVFVLFLPLTGCYADRGQLENNNLNAEDQPQGEQDRIIPSYTILYEAIKNRELEKAIALLQEALKDDKGVDLMQRDEQGLSLLQFAIVNAESSQEVLYIEIVNLLIKLKQDVNARDNEANTPLHIAASKELFLVAEELIKNGANIYAENEQGEIPLHCAAEEGNIKIVRLLIDQDKTVKRTMKSLIPTGLNNYIDKKDNHGRTPLYLVMNKFSLCVGNVKLGTPEKYVCINPEKYVYIIKLLVASGANVHTEDKYGMTLLHIAARGGCVEMVRMLLEEQVRVNHCDINGCSPLEMAMVCSSVSAKAKNYLAVVNMLIEAGANVYYKDKYNYNLLHCAAREGNVEILKLLIDHKIEINSKTAGGYTPLHFAVAGSVNSSRNSNSEILLEEQCYLEVVDLLIQRGAIIDVKDDQGYTPLYSAILHSANRAYGPGLKDAIAIIKYLISLGLGINDVDGQGNTPLHLVAQQIWIPGFPEIVNLLIEAGANIHVTNNFGYTPLNCLQLHIKSVLL